MHKDISESRPLYSILIASYNNARYIKSTIESLNNQTYRNFEIIILDDLSNDNSDEVIENLANSNPKIRYYRNDRNYGCGYTKRRLCDLAQGDFLAFLDPDDILVENALEVMVKEFDAHPLNALIYSTHYICDQNLNIKQIAPQIIAIPKGETLLTYKDGCISHFAVFRKSNYSQTKGIDPTLKKAVDQDLYYILEETGNTHFINIPLYFYRIHEGGISSGKNNVSAYLWHLKTKIAAHKRRKNSSQYYKHLAIYYKIEGNYLKTAWFSILFLRHKLI